MNGCMMLLPWNDDIEYFIDLVMSIPSTAISTPIGNCSDGELRLEGSSDDMQAGTREGRIEICINNAWGTVCDTHFGREDAAVVCGQLEGFQSSGESWKLVASSANLFEQLHVEDGLVDTLLVLIAK